MTNLELSIQIRLNGFSFLIRSGGVEVSAGTIDGFDFSIVAPARVGAVAYDRMTVWCSVSGVTMVPLEVYSSECNERYLEALNLLGANCRAMAAAEGAAAVVWAMEGELIDKLAVVSANEVLWAHPLGYLVAGGGSEHISVLLDGGVAHLAVFDGEGLVGVRSIEVSAAGDVLYAAVEMSRRVDPERQFSVWLGGDVSSAVESLFGGCYRRVAAVGDPLRLLR